MKLDGVDARAAALIAIEPATGFSVNVPITFQHKFVPAPVVVKETGNVAPGYEVGPVSVNPSIVTLEGDPNIVGPVTSVDTDAINLNGATSDIQKTVSLRLPAGVTVAGGAQHGVGPHHGEPGRRTDARAHPRADAHPQPLAPAGPTATEPAR